MVGRGFLLATRARTAKPKINYEATANRAEPAATVTLCVSLKGEGGEMRLADQVNSAVMDFKFE